MTRMTVLAALSAIAMGLAGCQSMSGMRDDGARGATGMPSGSGSVLEGSHPLGATDQEMNKRNDRW